MSTSDGKIFCLFIFPQERKEHIEEYLSFRGGGIIICQEELLAPQQVGSAS